MKVRTILTMLVVLASVVARSQSDILLDAVQKLRDRGEIEGYNTMDQEYGSTNCEGEATASLTFAPAEFRGGRTYMIFILVDDCDDCTVDLYWTPYDDPDDDLVPDVKSLGCEMSYYEGGLAMGKQNTTESVDSYGQIGFCVNSTTPHYTRGLLFVTKAD